MKTKVLLVSALTSLVALWSLGVLPVRGRTAEANVSRATCMANYTPTFEEWLDLWLTAKCHYKISGEGNISSVPVMAPGRGRRWRIVCFYRPGGHLRAKFARLLKLQREEIAANVAIWRRRGYDIHMTDFTFEMKPFP